MDNQHRVNTGVRPIERTNVLGVGISAINLAQAVDAIDRWIEGGALEIPPDAGP